MMSYAGETQKTPVKAAGAGNGPRYGRAKSSKVKVPLDEHGIPFPPPVSLNSMINKYNEAHSSAKSSGKYNEAQSSAKPSASSKNAPRRVRPARNKFNKADEVKSSLIKDKVVEEPEKDTKWNATVAHVNCVTVTKSSLQSTKKKRSHPRKKNKSTGLDKEFIAPIPEISADSIFSISTSVNTSVEAVCSENSLQDLTSSTDVLDLEVDVRQSVSECGKTISKGSDWPPNAATNEEQDKRTSQLLHEMFNMDLSSQRKVSLEPVRYVAPSPGPPLESAPLPQTESAPLPQTESAPLPQTESAPLPQTESAPLPQTESAPLPQTESTPIKSILKSPKTPLPAPKWRDFQNFPIDGLCNVYNLTDKEYLIIEVKERKHNLEQEGKGGYHFIAVYVCNPNFKKAHNSCSVMNEAPVIVLQPTASPLEIRRAIYASVRRIMGKDANFMPRKGNPGDSREPVCGVSVPYLNTEGIFVIRKRRIRFPKAVYYCRLCDYHLANTNHAKKHIMTDGEHLKERYNRRLLENLLYLPPPCENQCAAMETTLKGVDGQYCRPADILMQCADLCDILTDLFKERISKDIVVRVYGSCQTGMALNDSNLNLEIVFPNQSNHAQILIQAQNVLMEEGKHNLTFEGVELVFLDVRWPYVAFTPAIGCLCQGIQVKLSVKNEQAYFIGRLIRCYVDLWPHLPILGRCFRVWAKMNDLDDYHEKMSLPPYAFDIMLIHFLQQKNVLPVLHEINESGQVAGSANPDAFVAEKYACEPDVVHKAFPMRQDQDIARLWIDLFRFYGIELNTSTWVVQIRSKKPVTRESKGWGCKKLGIEDPFLGKKNLGSMPTTMWDYFCRALSMSCKYMCIPQTRNGPLFTLDDTCWKVALRPISRSNSPIQEQCASQADGTSDNSEGIVINCSDKGQSSPPAQLNVLEEDVQDIMWSILEEIEAEANEDEASRLSDDGSLSDGEAKSEVCARKQVQYDTKLIAAALKVPVEDYCYTFESANFCDVPAPKPECKYCGTTGHVSKNCPEKVLPTPVPLPPMKRDYLTLLNLMIYYEQDSWQLNKEREGLQLSFLANLQRYLRANGFPNAILNLFGSSVNGFGFNDSDLDICMTFDGHRTMPQDMDPIKTIKTISRLLYKCREYKGITPVTKAKVPIVKFYNTTTQWDGDISLYNCLALRNTQLLLAYASFDPRVKALGVYIKVFAKSCGIGDASRGSLSSYAYVILLLHFLQRVSPPVIPVLQEIKVPEDCSSFEVDGWNTYFYENHYQLKYDRNLRPELENKMTAAELLVEFIRYYCERFDFDRDVVQIRQSSHLTKFEKMWNEKPMAIEDPFDLNHNLAAGLSRRMYIHIRKSLLRAREVLADSTTLQSLHEKGCFPGGIRFCNIALVSEHFFVELLPLEEQVPTDRQCRICGHVGHLAEACPQSRKVQKIMKGDDKVQARNKTPNNSPVDGSNMMNRQRKDSNCGSDRGRAVRGRGPPPRNSRGGQVPLFPTMGPRMQSIILPRVSNVTPYGLVPRQSVQPRQHFPPHNFVSQFSNNFSGRNNPKNTQEFPTPMESRNMPARKY